MSKKEEKIKKRLTAKKINQLTEGIFSTLFDVTLFCLFLPLCSLGKRPNSRDVYKAFEETEILLEEVNYKKLKHSLEVLRRNGFIESLKNWAIKPVITAAGKKRLKNILPQYDEERPWDGKIYLISYDFEVKQNRIRDLFREYIKRLGAFKLQESFYLIFNDPYQFIEDFKKEYHPRGAILVSELGKKGFIGEKDLKTFLWENSGLEEVNREYQEFIEKYQGREIKTPFFKIAIEYYSTLKKDPQLPFKLLPSEYLGDEAYLLFKKLIKKLGMVRKLTT